MSTTELLPDVERLTSRWLRARPAITALVADRVYTAWPHSSPEQTRQPLLLIQRVGGAPIFSLPLVLDAAELQLDAYGGPKHASHALAATACRELVELTDQPTEDGVVHAVTIGAKRWLPDESFSPPRPRYVCDITLTVTARPPAGTTTGSAARRAEGE